MANERTSLYLDNNGLIPAVLLPASVATLTGTQTLTNKTLTSPVISTINNTGTLTLPTATDTLVGRATSDTLTNKTISGASNTLTNIGQSSLTNGYVDLSSAQTNIAGAKTFTDVLTVTRSAANSTVVINGDSGQEKRVTFRTGNSDRWRFGPNAVAESGSNAGSNLVLSCLTDAGGTLFTIYTVTRSTGVTDYASPLRFSGATNSGLTVNSLTTTQRDALTTPPNGTVIYNTTANKTQFRENGAWVDLGTGAGSSSVFADDVFRIQDNADTTKQLAFEVSGVPTATTRTLTVPSTDGTLALLNAFVKDTASSGAVSITGDANKVYKFKPASPLTANRTITLQNTGNVTGAMINFSFADMVTADFSTFNFTITDSTATFTQIITTPTRFAYIWSGTAWEYLG